MFSSVLGTQGSTGMFIGYLRVLGTCALLETFM